MKRKLTSEERDLTKKGIKNRELRIKEFSEELDYLTSFNIFNEKYKDYLENKRLKEKKQKEDMIKQTHDGLIKQLEFEKAALEKEKLQLLEGVEVKKMIGVN